MAITEAGELLADRVLGKGALKGVRIGIAALEHDAEDRFQRAIRCLARIRERHVPFDVAGAGGG